MVRIRRQLILSLSIWMSASLVAFATEPGLVGYWKLQGDCLDHSDQGNHGINHRVNLQTSEFSGRDSYIEVPNSPSLNFSSRDFSAAAWVYTARELDDVIGDLVTKFDAAHRKGFQLLANASNPGYNAQSNVRNLFFGLDNGTTGRWTDCGRPNPRTHNSDALTIFEGNLYAGTTDGPDKSDWAHVYRYQGGQEWEDCGRLGQGATRGVYAMVVHDGALYAATAASHGRQPASMDFGRVYRYRGGQNWEDIGQPAPTQRLHSLASFQGKLYVTAFNIGDTKPGQCCVYEGDQSWRTCGEFNGTPHAMAVHDGRLYVAYPRGEVYAYDGSAWENLGNPLGNSTACSQIHSLGVYRGELVVGTWPLGKVAVWRAGKWLDLGRLGDATEVIALTVYNGSLYAGSIPRAEIFRFDGLHQWTSLKRLFEFAGFEPVPVGSGDKAVEDWTRASGLAIYQGKLFVSTATCYRTMMATPRSDDIRGKVFSYVTGATVSLDRDLGADWKHVAAVREGKMLKLYVNGTLAESAATTGENIDVSNESPLQIGFGPQSHFRGKIREVRLYNQALSQDHLQTLAGEGKFSNDSAK